MAIKKFLNQNTSTDCKLYLPFDGADGATSTSDLSPENHSITFEGDAQLDTAEKKFGTASLLLDGTEDYITSPDSDDWEIGDSNTNNKTISMWINVSNSCYILSQYNSDNSKWRINHSTTYGIKFALQTGGAIPMVAIQDTANPLDDGEWHHIALIKVANIYSLYVDGDQRAYQNQSNTGSVGSSLLYLGQSAAGSAYVNGWIDDLAFFDSNIFNAVPVVGLTDTITVPTSPFSVALIGKVSTTNLANIAKIIGITK